MSREEAGPDFVTALARGLEVLRCFSDHPTAMTLTELSSRTNLARATVRRIIITLEHLGYVKATDDGFIVTPRVLELGTAHTLASGIWESANPYLTELVKITNQAASIAELDGSDVFYVARVAVPKMVSLAITVGMRLPATNTALGRAILAFMDPGEVEQILQIPSRSSIYPNHVHDRAELLADLETIRKQGWALSDEDLHPAVRSVAVPLRTDDGRVFAAMNIAAVASEVSLMQLVNEFLPVLQETALSIGKAYSLHRAAPQRTLGA
ncbi:MAG: helix-turn-helix domain-containing protein [Leucobacter sp.]|nr:helix-turn-helix domain-containing protein [Leucobacter sp.]